MTLLSAYKAATPLKSGPVSWVKEVTEPHLPKGWTKYVCMKNGKKISKLVQYRDSDGKKYKNLKAVEDYLSNIIIRNSWQNVAPWNDFLKKMVTVKNQKPAFKMPNPVGRPRKDKQTLTTKTSQISQPQPSLITAPPPPQSQPLPVLPLPFSGGMASELMVTNHFRARRPPGPPGPTSPEPAVQTPLPADEIKLEPEEYKEEPTDVNPPTTLEIAVPPTTDNQKKTSPNDEKELVLPKIKTMKITPLNTSSQNLTGPTNDISKETSKKFQCSVCHIIFEDKKTLVKHLTVHQQCNICNILFKTKGTWIKHMENVHKDAIQKKKQDPKIIQKPAKVGNISSDSHVETIGNHKVVTPNEVQHSDDADTKESILEAVPIKLEASPILSDDQLSVNRKRLTSIGDVLVEDQNEIELSFSQKSLKKETKADRTTIKEEPLNTSNLMLDESLDNSNMVLDESTASVVDNTSLPDNGITKVNKDIDNVVNRESEKDTNEVEKESEKSSIPVSTDNDEVALRWYEGTFFTCRVMKSSTETCGKEFTGRKPFRLHLGHDHGVKLKTNELNGLKSFASKSKEGTYKCKSCLKLVKHDLFGISHHLMKTHSLTLDDYAKQFETVQSCKTGEATKENYEDGKSIAPVQISKHDEGSKQNDVKKGIVEVTENPEIILKKTKLNSQILLGEKHLKEYQKHIEELDVSNSTESVKISESSKQTDILKSELFERIAAIEREKEVLLKKANEFDEVIMENLNQIAKIEQVNNNRKSILQKRSGEVMENIRKAKVELEALLNEKEEKMTMPVEPCNPASNKEENILVEAEQESGLKKTNEEASQVESSIEPEPLPVLPVGVVEIKDEIGETLEKETDTVVTTTKTTIEPTIIKEKSVLAIMDNKLEPLENKQEVVGDDSIDKNKESNEKPPKKGSILEQKISALKRKSVEMEPSSTACIVPEDNDSEGVSVDCDSSKAEVKIENSKAEAIQPLKRGTKKRSEDVRKTLKDAHVDTSKIEGPVENSDVKVSQPKKRGRKKLSDEEKATRKALRIDSKRLSNSKPTVEGIENSFVFEDIETDIPGLACVPAIVITKDEDALKTHELIEKKIDGKDTASNAFQNVQDSIQKSKKKMKKKVSGTSPQRAVRDLTDLFAEIEEESDMLEKKGDKKTKLEAAESKEKTDKATKGANQSTKNGLKKARGLAGTSKKSTNSRTKNLKKRKSIHMSNGNVEGAESIQNINKKGRNSL